MEEKLWSFSLKRDVIIGVSYLDGFVRDIDENQFEAGEVPLGRGGD